MDGGTCSIRDGEGSGRSVAAGSREDSTSWATALSSGSGGDVIITDSAPPTPALPPEADPDVALITACAEEHSRALMQDLVGQVVGIKQRMAAAGVAALAEQAAAADARLAAQLDETDVLKRELAMATTCLAKAQLQLSRCCSAHGAKVQRVHDTRTLLHCWYAWRRFVAHRRRLARAAERALTWYARDYLYHRVFTGWLEAARGHFRLLAAQRSERAVEAVRKELGAAHTAEANALRQELAAGQAALVREAAARDKLEEDMKRAFMRGVTALNIEALQVIGQRGMPPGGANPFPVTVRLPAVQPAGSAGGGDRVAEGSGSTDKALPAAVAAEGPPPKVVVTRGPAGTAAGSQRLRQPGPAAALPRPR